MIPFAFPIFETTCKPSPPRKRTNRLALLLFVLTASLGLAAKYLP